MNLPVKTTWEMRSLNTHLFPGARLLHSSPEEPELKSGDILVITFSDMIRTSAEVIAAEAKIARIKVDGYQTEHGTTIISKTWFMRRIDPVQGSACYSIMGRAYESSSLV
jgi:hypothetical protein